MKSTELYKIFACYAIISIGVIVAGVSLGEVPKPDNITQTPVAAVRRDVSNNSTVERLPQPQYQRNYGIDPPIDRKYLSGSIYGSSTLSPGNYDNQNYLNNALGTGSSPGSGGLPGGLGNVGYNNELFGIPGFDENSMCPEHWFAFRQTCYRFVKSPKKQWIDAKRLCKAYQADLAHIDTIDKHAFILKHLIVENQRQYRYLVSAKQDQPNRWINDDGTTFLRFEDSISYESSDFDFDYIRQKPKFFQLSANERTLLLSDQGPAFIPGSRINGLNGNIGPNQFLANRIDQSNSVSPDGNTLPDGTFLKQDQPNQHQNPIGPQTSLNHNPLLYPGGIRDPYDNNIFLQLKNEISLRKNRMVYGYSRLKDRWMFIPVYDFELSNFLCEARQLYNMENINERLSNKRKYDYGIEIKTSDYEKIPRGPYFVVQPVDATFDTNQRKIRNWVEMYCLAAGYPTPTYSWFKEEYNNDNLTFFEIDPMKDVRYTLSGGNLIIHSPEQRKDQGKYHCVAENKYGKVRSTSVFLHFGYIMEFNLKRSNEAGEMYWGKSLFCDPPQHYPSVQYYWSRDWFPNFVEEDRRVFVSYDGALYFSALESIDRGNYSCTVQNYGSTTGRNGPFFSLQVRPHPNYQALIFANSFPKVFPEAPIANEEIRLECVAFGYPIPSYNWTRRDNGGQLPRQAILASYNRVLIIPNATINDNGEYTCTVQNDRKTLRKSLVLNIQQRPNFTIPLFDQIKDYNTQVSFMCEANAIPDVNYTWYKNGVKLNRDVVDRDKFTVQDNVLTIKYLDPDKDNGMYQCAAENQLQMVFSSAQLRVLSMKPSFKKNPLESEIYAVYNGNTTINCDPEAAPRPRIQWKKDGNIIGSGGHRRILPTGTLIISPTSRDDEGVYTCMATNSYGTDESKARLIVLQEIRFTVPLQPRILTEVFDTLFMNCDVSRDELLDVAFIWKHNGVVIEDISDIYLPFFERRVIVNYNTLEIRNVSVLDSGEYECIAKSSVNEISSRGIVVVQGPPGMPGGVKVVDIQKRSATLEWIDGAENGRPVLFYNILGRTNWNKTWVNVSQNVEAFEVDRYTGRKQATIHNLNPWSGYEFSVCAVNVLGIGPQSAPSPMYNTYTDKPYRAPTNVRGGGGKIGDLRIQWDPLPQEEQNAPGIYYKIFWRLHGSTGEWASEVLKDRGNIGTAVVSIALANYYTKYDVRVQTFNDVGQSDVSNTTVIYSAEDMPQVAPQQTYAQGFNSTSMNVTWNPVELTRENIRGKLIGHRIKYWKKDFNELDSTYYLSRTTRNWALIVGLEPDTYYFVKVMVFNAAGEGPESERYLERTYRKAPQKPPSAVTVFGYDPSTIRVTWRYVSPAIDEEPVIGFKIRIWEADQDMSTANDTYVPVGNKLEKYINTLTPGKAYKLRVLAFSNGGDGRMSSPTHHFQMGNTDYRNSASGLRIDFIPTLFTFTLAVLSIWFNMIRRL